TTLLRCSFGSMTRGPPQPPAPFEIFTALYVFVMMSSPPGSELDALAAGHEGRDALGQHALEQDDHEPDDGVPDRDLDVISGSDRAPVLQFQQCDEDTAPDEIFARIDVREQAERRVNIGHRGVIE